MAAAKAAAGEPRKRRTSASSTAKTKQARSKDARDDREQRTKASARAGAAAAARRRKSTAARKADEPPRDLPALFQAYWVTCRERLTKDGSWQPTIVPLLDQLVRCLHEAQYMRAAAEAEPLVEGSMGQLVDHPGFGRADKAESQALKIAAALLLTPASRRLRGLTDQDPPKDPMEDLLGGD